MDKRWIGAVTKRLGLYGVAIATLGGIRTLQFRLSPDVRAVTIGDATADFHVSTPNEFSALRSVPEREVVADVVASLEPDDTFWDVGANIGLYSCLAADVVVEGSVVAFEPEPKNGARLRENVRLNDADVEVFEYALSDANETREFSVTLFEGDHQTGPAGHGFVADGDADVETIQVESVVGDDLVRERSLPVPSVVKIDVEGGEWDVLSGLERTLSHPDCRLVYCELHEDRLRAQGHSTQAVLDELGRMGFDVEVPFTPYGDPFVRATK